MSGMKDGLKVLFGAAVCIIGLIVLFFAGANPTYYGRELFLFIASVFLLFVGALWTLAALLRTKTIFILRLFGWLVILLSLASVIAVFTLPVPDGDAGALSPDGRKNTMVYYASRAIKREMMQRELRKDVPAAKNLVSKYLGELKDVNTIKGVLSNGLTEDKLVAAALAKKEAEYLKTHDEFMQKNMTPQEYKRYKDTFDAQVSVPTDIDKEIKAFLKRVEKKYKGITRWDITDTYVGWNYISIKFVLQYENGDKKQSYLDIKKENGRLEII